MRDVDNGRHTNARLLFWIACLRLYSNIYTFSIPFSFTNIYKESAPIRWLVKRQYISFDRLGWVWVLITHRKPIVFHFKCDNSPNNCTWPICRTSRRGIRLYYTKCKCQISIWVSLVFSPGRNVCQLCIQIDFRASHI